VNLLARLAAKIYRLMLACYPAEFRVEFGAEMQIVFSIAMKAVQHSGKDKFWKLVWREFRCWPGSVIQEHLQARRNKMTVQDQFTPIRPAELLAALTIFLIPTIATLLVTLVGAGYMNKLPKWLDIILQIFFLGSLIAAFGFAIIRGLPRWSPPYLGILIVTLLLLGPFWPMQRLWEWAYSHIYRALGQMSTWSMLERVLYQGVQEAILWSFVLLIAVILITLLRLLPYTRSLWRRVREDWTQLSFLVYGGIVIYILFIFDEYRQKELWSLASWIFLAIGCLLYLYSKEKYQRILILLCGATLAMWIVAVGKWFLVPIQDWGPYLKSHPPETERWFEFYRTMAEWICIVIALLSPALLSFLPTSPPQNVQEEIGSV
jgi:hypothetical protein